MTIDDLVSINDGLYRTEKAYSAFRSATWSALVAMSVVCRPRPYLTPTQIDTEKPTAATQAARIHQSSCLIDLTRKIRVKKRAVTKTVAKTIMMIVTADVTGPRSAAMLARRGFWCLRASDGVGFDERAPPGSSPSDERYGRFVSRGSYRSSHGQASGGRGG